MYITGTKTNESNYSGVITRANNCLVISSDGFNADSRAWMINYRTQ